VTAFTVNDGNGGANYSVTSNTAAGTITAKALQVNAVTDTKVYDATTTSAATPVNVGLVGADTVTGATQSFGSKNVLGLNGSTLSVNGGSFTVNDGNGGANYSVTSATALGTITAKAASVNAVTDTKVYDGTTSSSATPTSAGLVGGDTVTGATQSFGSKNVLGANGSTLSVNGGSFTVNDGNGGANYSITLNTAAGTITARPVTLTAPSVTKTYDGGLTYGTTAGDLTSITGSGPLVGGDTVTTATIAYTNKDVGLGNKTVTLSGVTVNDGNGGANYTVTLSGNSTSTINQLSSVTYIGASGGLWSVAANWAGNAIPDLGNVASVNLNGQTVNMNLAGVQSTSVSNGSLNMTTGSFNGPSFTASLVTYNQTGGSISTSGNISITTSGNLTPGSIVSSLGSVTLTAAAILGTSTCPAICVSGASGIFSSNADVTGLGVDFQGKSLILTGSAASWTMNGPATAPTFSVTNGATNIFYNGSPISGAAVVALQQSGSVIGSTLADISRAALLATQDTDSVQKQIAYGFVGDVGTTPPMDHRIDETGISVPKCMNDSREGQACQ
jgi:hypothetical protein